MFDIFSTAAALAAGIIKTAFGIGAGVLLTPLLSLSDGPKIAVGLLAPVMLATDITGLTAHWKKWDRHQLQYVVPAGLVGVAIGSSYFSWAPVELTRITIGLIAMVFSLLQIYRANHPEVFYRFRPGRKSAVAIGFVAGMASAVAHAGGIVLTLYLVSIDLPKRTFIATMIGFLFFNDILKMIMFARLGILTRPLLVTGIELIPVLLLGSWLGSRLTSRLNNQQFVRYINVLIFSAGLLLILKAGPLRT